MAKRSAFRRSAVCQGASFVVDLGPVVLEVAVATGGRRPRPPASRRGQAGPARRGNVGCRLWRSRRTLGTTSVGSRTSRPGPPLPACGHGRMGISGELAPIDRMQRPGSRGRFSRATARHRSLPRGGVSASSAPAAILTLDRSRARLHVPDRGEHGGARHGGLYREDRDRSRSFTCHCRCFCVIALGALLQEGWVARLDRRQEAPSARNCRRRPNLG